MKQTEIKIVKVGNGSTKQMPTSIHKAPPPEPKQTNNNKSL